MKIQGNNPVIDVLLNENDKIVFNLIFAIKDFKESMIYTDGKSYLTAQMKANCPMWIYANEKADKNAEREIFNIVSEAFANNSKLSINAQNGFIVNVLKSVAKYHGLNLSKHGTLNAYSINNVREIISVGNIIIAEPQHEEIITELIKVAAIDDNDGELTDKEAKQFAAQHVGTGNLFLWADKKVVSMARIIKYNKDYARITSVVTAREVRGNGYAKMLVGELSKRLLAEKLTPVLYARTENLSSNKCYAKLGFEKKGEICEYCIE